jgi:hypothetical protein
LGQVGTDWQFSALGASGGNTTMLLRNAGTGGFELYGISNNIVTSPSWARSGSIGSSRASAISAVAASPT